MSAKARAAREPTGRIARRQGLRRLPDLLGQLLDAPARRRGLVNSTLLEDWPMIVGPALARHCHPVRLDRREPPVLQLRVGGGAALEIQHAAPQIIERINQHFGFRAVARLRLVQAPLGSPRRAAVPAPAALSAEAERAVEQAVAPVVDPGLRAALRSLGRALPRSPAGGA